MGKTKKIVVKKSKVVKPDVKVAKAPEEAKPALSVVENLNKSLAEATASGNTAAVTAIQREINRQKRMDDKLRF